jgi:RNA polymerase sigma-70 factor, ECF subfamily
LVTPIDHDLGVAHGEAFQSTLAAAQAGGEWAVASLYRSVNPSLLRYLKARIANDAEDVAADTWLDVARSLATFEGGENDFTAWVFTIARRRVVDHRRREGRRRESADEALADVAAPGDAESAALEGRLGDEAARRMVACLPDEQADIVLLRVVGGFSVEEVSRLTGRRPGTVRVLQHRALKRLAREIGEDL